MRGYYRYATQARDCAPRRADGNHDVHPVDVLGAQQTVRAAVVEIRDGASEWRPQRRRSQ